MVFIITLIKMGKYIIDKKVNFMIFMTKQNIYFFSKKNRLLSVKGLNQQLNLLGHSILCDKKC